MPLCEGFKSRRLFVFEVDAAAEAPLIYCALNCAQLITSGGALGAVADAPEIGCRFLS